MTRLSEVHWLSDAQREELGKHHVLTLEALATFELRDSMADVIPIDNLRTLARQARRSLGRPDPLEQIGQASGHSGPVKYAGGMRYGDD